MEGFSTYKGHKNSKEKFKGINEYFLSNTENYFVVNNSSDKSAENINMTFISGLDYKHTHCVTNHADVCPLLHVNQCTRVQILTEHVPVEL